MGSFSGQSMELPNYDEEINDTNRSSQVEFLDDQEKELSILNRPTTGWNSLPRVLRTKILSYVYATDWPSFCDSRLVNKEFFKSGNLILLPDPKEEDHHILLGELIVRTRFNNVNTFKKLITLMEDSLSLNELNPLYLKFFNKYYIDLRVRVSQKRSLSSKEISIVEHFSDTYNFNLMEYSGAISADISSSVYTLALRILGDSFFSILCISSFFSDFLSESPYINLTSPYHLLANTSQTYEAYFKVPARNIYQLQISRRAPLDGSSFSALNSSVFLPFAGKDGIPPSNVYSKIWPSLNLNEQLGQFSAKPLTILTYFGSFTFVLSSMSILLECLATRNIYRQITLEPFQVEQGAIMPTPLELAFKKFMEDHSRFWPSARQISLMACQLKKANGLPQEILSSSRLRRFLDLVYAYAFCPTAFYYGVFKNLKTIHPDNYTPPRHKLKIKLFFMLQRDNIIMLGKWGLSAGLLAGFNAYFQRLWAGIRPKWGPFRQFSTSKSTPIFSPCPQNVTRDMLLPENFNYSGIIYRNRWDYASMNHNIDYYQALQVPFACNGVLHIDGGGGTDSYLRQAESVGFNPMPLAASLPLAFTFFRYTTYLLSLIIYMIFPCI